MSCFKHLNASIFKFNMLKKRIAFKTELFRIFLSSLSAATIRATIDVSTNPQLFPLGKNKFK